MAKPPQQKEVQLTFKNAKNKKAFASVKVEDRGNEIREAQDIINYINQHFKPDKKQEWGGTPFDQYQRIEIQTTHGIIVLTNPALTGQDVKPYNDENSAVGARTKEWLGKYWIDYLEAELKKQAEQKPEEKPEEKQTQEGDKYVDNPKYDGKVTPSTTEPYTPNKYKPTYGKNWEPKRERKWIQEWWKLQDEEFAKEGKTPTIFDRWGALLDHSLNGQVKIAVPFAGEIGTIEETVQTIPRLLELIGNAVQLGLYLMSDMPEIIEAILETCKLMEEHDKNVMKEIAPMIKAINEELVPYINGKQKLDEAISNHENLPFLGAPADEKQLAQYQALLDVLNAPFGLGNRYRNIINTALKKDYMDSHNVGWYDHFAMYEDALNTSIHGTTLSNLAPIGIGAAAAGAAGGAAGLASQVPRWWLATENAGKQFIESVKAEHAQSHKDMKKAMIKE